jgi:uncharacterized protein
MSARAPDVLVVMAKFPEPGRVKTRLAAWVGAAAACELYRAFLADLAARLANGAWELVWAVSPPGSRLDEIVGGPPARHLDQRRGGLAGRMHACFAELFAAGARRVVMIGADAPLLDAATIGDAFAVLAESDVVVVPSRDGGYCLVGSNAPRDIFNGIAMSTDRVLAQTRARCRELDLVLRELPEQFDVDDGTDVARLADAIAAGADLPATAAVLQGWRRAGKL